MARDAGSVGPACPLRGPAHAVTGRPVRLLLLAPPGAGKSTQGRALGQLLGVPFVSVGDLLRAEVGAQTALGRLVEGHLARGELVPDEHVADLVRRRLEEPDAAHGVVLDGFPRTLDQARIADAWSDARGARGLGFSAVVHLDVSEDELARRIAERATVSGRVDDTEETWRRRLAEYRSATSPLLDLYRPRGVLIDVDGSGDVDAVRRGIVRSLRRRGILSSTDGGATG